MESLRNDFLFSYSVNFISPWLFLSAQPLLNDIYVFLYFCFSLFFLYNFYKMYEGKKDKKDYSLGLHGACMNGNVGKCQ